jgi:hypothetical protein
MVLVDRGYNGVDIEHVQVWRSGQKRGVTQGLKAMIRRRSAIEPTIGHMKTTASWIELAQRCRQRCPECRALRCRT